MITPPYTSSRRKVFFIVQNYFTTFFLGYSSGEIISINFVAEKKIVLVEKACINRGKNYQSWKQIDINHEVWKNALRRGKK